MNLAEALAHVAAHRAAGNLDQLDTEIGFQTEADRDLRALWAWELLEPGVPGLALVAAATPDVLAVRSVAIRQ